MIHSGEIVQILVLYVTVLLGVLLYVSVLSRLEPIQSNDNRVGKRRTHLTLALVGVITMIFGVGCAHQIWPRANVFWLPILGILIVSAAVILYRFRRLSPKTN